MRYFILFLIIGFLCNSITEAYNNASSKILNLKPTISLMHNLSVHFLKTCNFNFKKVIIYNNVSDEDTFSAFAAIQPQTSVSLLSNVIAWKRVALFRFDDIKVDAVMIVIDVEYAWNRMEDLFIRWRFQRDCIVYIFPVPLYDCANYKEILKLIMRFYFSAAYFICLNQRQYPLVYTHDPYGDTTPSHWNKVSQEFIWGKNWTFYRRSYKKDISELCPGFYFERTDPINKILPILGLHNDQINRKFMRKGEKLFNDKIERYLISDYREQAHNLKRLLNLKFQYYIVQSPRHERMLIEAHEYSGIDTVVFRKNLMKLYPLWNYFYPVNYDPYVIISHHRGMMTPLEKIAKFYGILTLSSLSILMIIVFIVIWLTTGNISLAVFDVIRLLINAEIIVAINSPSKKIFYCMIFLYFLIIHATFSGHLAEFLTSADYRHNIDIIEDLKDPRIEKIYYFGYQFDERREFDVLRQKSERITKSTECIRIETKPNSVCIAPLSRVLDMRDRNNSYHISKNTFGFSWLSNVYRPGFSLYENFNWAIMFLFDTRIINLAAKMDDQRVLRKIEKQIVTNRVDHRSITNDDLYFAFVLLIVGNCAGFICFLFEIGFTIASSKLKNHRKNEIIVVKPLQLL